MVQSGKIKAVLFDFDMTLVDSSYAIHHCTNKLAEHLGFKEISYAQVLTAIGMTIEDSWMSFWGEFKPEWVDYYRANFRGEEQSRLRLFPNSVDTLKKLRDMGCKVGVVSNRRFAKLPAEHLGLTSMLDVIVGLEDVERAKPHPDPLLKGFASVGVSPSEGIYVGDTDIDMKTSIAAGTRGVGMTTGNFTKDGLKAAGAWRVLSDLSEIPLLTD